MNILNQYKFNVVWQSHKTNELLKIFTKAHFSWDVIDRLLSKRLKDGRLGVIKNEQKNRERLLLTNYKMPSQVDGRWRLCW